MAIDREEIFEALFDTLKANVTSASFVTRKYIDYANIGMDRQPSLQLVAGPQERAANTKGRPPIWTLDALVILCGRTEQQDDTPEAQLHELAREVELALEDETGLATTLGGLVSHCWIAGPVEYVQGIQAGQAGVHMPLEILVAGRKG